MATLRAYNFQDDDNMISLKNGDYVTLIDWGPMKIVTGPLIYKNDKWHIDYFNNGEKTQFIIDKNILDKMNNRDITISKSEKPPSFADQYATQYSGIGNSNNTYVSSGYDNGYGGKRSRRKSRKSRRSRKYR